MTSVDIPESDGLIFTSTDEKLAIGTEGYGPYTIGMFRQDTKTVTCADFPDSDRLVIASTRKHAAIGTVGDGERASNIAFITNDADAGLDRDREGRDCQESEQSGGPGQQRIILKIVPDKVNTIGLD